jgi:hypothetical protein
MADPTGEADRGALQLDFDRRLMLQFRGSTITSDVGLLAYRELDDALHLTDTGGDTLADNRANESSITGLRERVDGIVAQFCWWSHRNEIGVAEPLSNGECGVN